MLIATFFAIKVLLSASKKSGCDRRKIICYVLSLLSACWAPNSASFVSGFAKLVGIDEQTAPHKAVILASLGMCVNIDL